jgi:electron transport complex protein RnfB
VLPQTQCTRCGFAACRPYAEAIARGEADVNRCPPGGVAGIEALAALTGRPVIPLDPACGAEKPLRHAWIVASDCIGCTKCIRACPVDAIIGGPQRLHAVLRERCTGCELCIPPCPVDCIELRPWEPERGWSSDNAAAARQRHALRTLRLQRQSEEIHRHQRDKAQAKLAGDTGRDARARAIIEAAIEKARKRLQESAQ